MWHVIGTVFRTIQVYDALNQIKAGKAQRWCWLCSQSFCVVMRQGYTGEFGVQPRGLGKQQNNLLSCPFG
uniref:Uncharacterized protein n=1 Tax=Buteo japonicus TaxID=224669 RepID=A0A8C0AXN7_9AVES